MASSQSDTQPQPQHPAQPPPHPNSLSPSSLSPSASASAFASTQQPPQHPPQSAPRPPYPRGVPSKFSPSGAVVPFPGNTILCHLPADCPLRAALLPLYARLASHPLKALYTLLPPASWHVTVFEGVCDGVRDGGSQGERKRGEMEMGKGVYWPVGLRADASLEECTALFERKLKGFDLGEAGPPYKLRVAGFSRLEVGIGVAVECVGEEERKRVRDLRNRLAGVLGIRHPVHEVYGFHVSLAYLLRHLSLEQERELREVLDGFLEEGGRGMEFELGRPEFCIFEDMFAFERVFYLGDGKEEGGH